MYEFWSFQDGVNPFKDVFFDMAVIMTSKEREREKKQPRFCHIFQAEIARDLRTRHHPYTSTFNQSRPALMLIRGSLNCSICCNSLLCFIRLSL